MTRDEIRAEYASMPPLSADRWPSGDYKYVTNSGYAGPMDPEIREVFRTAYETIAPKVPDAAGIFWKAICGDSLMRRHLLWLEDQVRKGQL